MKIQKLNESKTTNESVEYVKWVQLPDGKRKMWGSNPTAEFDSEFLDRARKQNNIDYRDAKVVKNGEGPEDIVESTSINESNIKHIYYHNDPTGLKKGEWIDVKEEDGKYFGKWSFNDDWYEIKDLKEMPYHNFHGAPPAKTFTWGGWRFWLDDEVEKFWDIEGKRIIGDFDIPGMPHVKRNKIEESKSIKEDYFDVQYIATSIDSLNDYCPGLGDACKDLKNGDGCSYKGYDIELHNGKYKVYLNESIKTFGAKGKKLNEARDPYFTPYGYRDAAKVLNGKAPEYYYHLKEIEMDHGDGRKLATYAKKLGLNVIEDPDSDPDYPEFYIPGEYHWNDYFYPYPSAYEPKQIDNDTKPDAHQMNESIDVATIADYITDHYEFDDIDDKYGCINSIRDSFKDEKTISWEELKQFIGAHNGRDKIEESVDTVTRYKVEYYAGDNDERLETYIYGDSKEEVRKQLVAKIKSEGIDYVMITAMIPETVPASYKANDLKEDKGQPRSKRYTTYFNRIKRAIEKGDKETLQRTKEAIMYAPAKELKNSEAAELMDMIKNMLNKPLKEDYSDEVVTLSRYLDIEVPNICEDVLDLIENLPSHKVEFLIQTCKAFYAKMERVINNYTMQNTDEDSSVVELKENKITNVEPKFNFKGKSSHTFTKDKKWEVDFDEKGNILARTRHGNPSYFKGHINDKVNSFPSTDEDNIVLAAREQHKLKFGELTEASYGGAYDIANDQLFTREDLVSCAEEILNHLNETFNDVFDLADVSLENGYFTIEVVANDLGWYSESVKIDMRKVREPWRLKQTYASDIAAKLIAQIKDYNNVNETLNEGSGDIEIDTLEGPKEGPEFGLASLLNAAIKDEWEAIETYNTLAVTARGEGFEDIANVVDEINTEENKHVGQLQQLLKTISPNTEAIKVGEEEGAEQLDSTDDLSDNEMLEAIESLNKIQKKSNNTTDIPNNINEDIEEEEVVDMREPWEDIYDSFKKLEIDLNGDGEAITATIDKIYQDNKGNPDFEKAYQKWASNE